MANTYLLIADRYKNWLNNNECQSIILLIVNGYKKCLTNITELLIANTYKKWW